MSSVKVLVTGANGFLGNNIVRVLIERNYQVVALVRPESDIKILEGLNCSLIRGNLSNFQEIEPAVKNCDYVIHSASLTAQNITDFEKYREANITSTKLLVNVCKRTCVKRFVLVSSASCFTGGSKENPGNEGSGFIEESKNSGYAYSKYLAQTFVLSEVKKNNFPAVIVAPAFMVGPYDPKPSSGKLILYILRNRLLLYPKGGKSFVDVKAVAIATVNALTLGQEGECFILSGINTTYKNYYKMVAALSFKKKRYLPIPGFLLHVLNNFVLLFPNKKLSLLKTNLRILFRDNYYTNARARSVLKMPPTALEPTISQSINWFRENGYLKK